MRINLTNYELEKLYITIKNIIKKDEEILNYTFKDGTQKIIGNENFLKNIVTKFNEYEFTNITIKYLMSKMKYIGILFMKYNEKNRVEEYYLIKSKVFSKTMQQKYKKIGIDKSKKIIEEVEKHIVNSNWFGDSLEELIEECAKENQVSIYEINELIIKNNLKKNGLPMKVEGIEDKINSFKIPEELKEELYKIRNILSSVFLHNKDDIGLIQSVNYGTGFGKSYGVFSRAFEIFEKDRDFRMIFMAPLKSQLKIDNIFFKKARELDISILPIYSRGDVGNPKNILWGYQDSDGNNKITLGERIAKWKKGYKSKNNKINNFISELSSKVHYYEKIYNDNIVEDIHKKIMLNHTINSIGNIIKNLVIEILNTYEGLENLINTKNNQAMILIDIIKHYAPFEYAKYKPSILILTVDKSEYKVMYFKKNNKNNYSVEYAPYDSLIGKKEEQKISKRNYEVGQESDRIKANFLSNEYFKEESKLKYSENIWFNIVIDEEHTSYDRIYEKRKKTIFGDRTSSDYSSIKNTNVVDLMSFVSSLYRIINSIEGEIDTNKKEIKIKYKNFIEDGLIDINFEKEIEYNKLLSMFPNLLRNPYINSNNYESIMNISKNVFSFSPKHFFNKNELKNIIMNKIGNGSDIELIYKEKKNKKEISVLNFYQFIIVLLYSFVKLNKKERNIILKDRSYIDQNNSLSLGAEIVEKFESEIEMLMSLDIEKTINIDYFFTYFLPKTIFSIERTKNSQEEIINNDNLDGIIRVSFKLNLFTEMPESTLLRQVSHTNNKISLLSATSGFKESLNGSFNRNCITKYSNILNYNVSNATDEKEFNIKDMRSIIGKFKNVEFKTFSDTYIQQDIYDNDLNEYFKEWYDYLNIEIEQINKYIYEDMKNILWGLLNATKDRKNTLILSSRNLFKKKFEDFLLYHIDNNPLFVETIDPLGIYKVSFIPNKKSVTLILLNSKLDNNSEKLEESMILKKPDDCIVIVSSYQSAGTGLNYFVTYQDETSSNKATEVDFERLILSQLPFYSSIKGKDNSLNNVNNFITIFKYIVQTGEQITIDDISTNIIIKYHNVLMKEHFFEIFKIIIQAIGRVERKDAKINNEIFLNEEIMDFVSGFFFYLHSTKDPLIESMSFLNYSLYEKSIKLMKDKIFIDDKSRKNFNKICYEAINTYEEFIIELLEINNNIRHSSITKEKALKLSSLNEAFREIESISNIDKYITKLSKIMKSLNFKESKIKRIIESLYFKRNNLKYTINEDKYNQEGYLTDYSESMKEYKPEYRIFSISKSLDISNNIKWIRSKKENKILDAFKGDFLPHPNFLDVLAGNSGEYIFKESFKRHFSKIENIKMIELEMLFEKSQVVYELFDFYIEKENTLYCIDIKYWSKNENKNITTQIIEKLENKKNTIYEEMSKFYKKIKFIYLNVNPGKNELNTFTEDDKNDVYFINLFKEYPQIFTIDDKYKKGKTSNIKIILDYNKSLWEILND